MRKGELSNQVLPRILVVFEDLIASLPDTKTKILAATAAKRKKWDQVANYYELNIKPSQGIRDLYWRHHYRVDVITFTDPNFVSPIREKLDAENMFFGGVHYYTPSRLLGDLTYDPSILAVFDPDESRILTWGSKGRYCSPDTLNLANILY